MKKGLVLLTLLVALAALSGCERWPRSRRTEPMPELHYQTGSSQSQVALIDVDALRLWCERRELPAPPGVDAAEPAVAEALYSALAAAAETRSAASLGQVGRVAASLDAHASAAEYFRLATEADPDDFRWTYYLGCAQQAMGEAGKAIEALERAKLLEPEYATTYARLGQLYLDEGDLTRASDNLDRYVETRPKDWFGHTGLGRIALMEGDTAAAQTHLERAVELQPADFQVQHQLGKLYVALGDTSRARQHFEAASLLPKGGWFLLRDPLMQEAKESTGSAAGLHREFERLSESGDWTSLVDLAERIVERRPDDATMLLNLARIYRKQQRFEESLATIDRGLALRDGDARFYRARAETLLAQGAFDDSLAAAEAALELEPGSRRSRSVRGRALLMLHRYPEAEADLRQAAQGQPDDPSTLFALGEALRLQGKRAEAAATYRRVLELQPQLDAARVALAQVETTGQRRPAE